MSDVAHTYRNFQRTGKQTPDWLSLSSYGHDLLITHVGNINAREYIPAVLQFYELFSNISVNIELLRNFFVQYIVRFLLDNT